MTPGPQPRRSRYAPPAAVWEERVTGLLGLPYNYEGSVTCWAGDSWADCNA